MAAHPNDLRWFYAARLGRAQIIAASNAGSAKNERALEPGRYLVYIHGLSADTVNVWVRQGSHDTVTATAAAPSTPMSLNSLRAFEMTVTEAPMQSPQSERGDESDDGIAAITDVGTASVVVVKISRDKN